MKRLSFVEAVIAALLFSQVGALLGHVLSPLFGVALVSRGLCTLLALAYVLFLVARSGMRHGRASLLVAWTLAALAIAVLSPSLFGMVAAHLVLVWLTRSLLLHSRLWEALADLLLSALSLAAGYWALLETGSVFVSLWSLGLVQAGCVLLPAKRTGASQGDAETQFNQAARAAEQALRAINTAR